MTEMLVKETRETPFVLVVREIPTGPAMTAGRARGAPKRALDVTLASLVLLLAAPVAAAVAVAIKLESPGPVLYRGRRVGRGGREFAMLKFRKMRGDAHARPLTLSHDERFTRIGRLLSKTKLDELPQFVNVLRGEMSLVGPRPEDVSFVAEHPDAFGLVLAARPGITGYAQLAFARESAILDPDDPLTHYRETILPQKLALDRMYVSQAGVLTDLRILAWTAVAVLLRREVAVHRGTGRLGLRAPRGARS
jgi:lipopolysaccharide/colanic/teichoic acid biosynthesis glycosyltransferase